VSVERGREAAKRGDWKEARAAFEAALAGGQTAEAVEGLALASTWLWEPEAALGGFERAYRLYRRGGDPQGAARAAMWLSLLAYNLTSDTAVARGWLGRARRLLEGLGAVPEQGWVALLSGHAALLAEHDLDEARRFCDEAASVGLEIGDADIEALARAQRGLLLVTLGQIDEGMRLLDESTAAAIGGDLTDVLALTTIPCYLIYACKRVRDYDRAAEWCDLAKEIAARFDDRVTFAACRLHYADVLVWRGAWADAERELDSATRELATLGRAKVVDAAARLGEIRRRQGRLGEAEALFRQSEHHPVAMLGRAALALDRADAEGALELTERFLRRISAEERTERVPGLELLVRARLAAGDAEGVGEALAELRSIAAAVDTSPLRAALALAEGVEAAATARSEEARRRFEDAVDLYEECGAPFEAATSRRELARALRTLGRYAAADQEARIARRILEELGVAFELELAPHAARDGLTRREREILRLLARGLSNQEIAADLVLSVRTVERHISNIYDKIGASGKTARAAAATYAAELGV
jgi:LuxR family transcriptional regulator, maltose regulon positive regulatory protein